MKLPNQLLLTCLNYQPRARLAAAYFLSYTEPLKIYMSELASRLMPLSKSSLQKEARFFKRTVPSFHIGDLHYKGGKKNKQETITNISICTKSDKRSCYVMFQNGYAFAMLKASKTKQVSDMYSPVWLQLYSSPVTAVKKMTIQLLPAGTLVASLVHFPYSIWQEVFSHKETMHYAHCRIQMSYFRYTYRELLVIHKNTDANTAVSFSCLSLNITCSQCERISSSLHLPQ